MRAPDRAARARLLAPEQPVVQPDLGVDGVGRRHPVDRPLHPAPVRGVSAARVRVVGAPDLDDLAVVLLGRPYVCLAPGMNKGVPDILGALGVKTFFMDMLDVGDVAALVGQFIQFAILNGAQSNPADLGIVGREVGRRALVGDPALGQDDAAVADAHADDEHRQRQQQIERYGNLAEEQEKGDADERAEGSGCERRESAAETESQQVRRFFQIESVNHRWQSGRRPAPDHAARRARRCSAGRVRCRLYRCA